MTAIILNNAPIFWLTLGGLLLAAEMIGVSGYLLWSSIAAILTGLLTWLLLIGCLWQSIDFAILTVVAALLWTRWLKRQKRSGHDNGLNQRVRQLTGQHYWLEQALENGRGYVRIGDSRWPVQADSDLPAGSLVEVTAVEGITLQVRRVNS